jgi:hypothetical protein
MALGTQPHPQTLSRFSILPTIQQASLNWKGLGIRLYRYLAQSMIIPSIPLHSRRLCPIPILGCLACIITVLRGILRSKDLGYCSVRTLIINHLWLTVYALSLKPSPALSYTHTLVRLAMADQTKNHASELWPIGASRITTTKTNRLINTKMDYIGGNYILTCG